MLRKYESNTIPITDADFYYRCVYFGMLVMGFSINMITLFAMILAIEVVVVDNNDYRY